MRRRATAKWALAALAGALCLGAEGTAAEGSAGERLQREVQELGASGPRELPYAAWALLDIARRSADPALAERAVELAPDTPAVLLEAGLSWKRPDFAARGLAALAHSYPALLWLVVAGGAVLGSAALLAAGILALLAALRGLPLAGHGLSHLGRGRQPASWPGILVWIGGLALLAGLGAGPVPLLALAGCAGALRLRPAESVTAAIALATAGLVLGPGLDLWARPASGLEREGALASAWRVERGHPLPGDEAVLERALARRPGDSLVRLALASARARAGDTSGAASLIGSAAPADRPDLRAAELGLQGAVEFASGDLSKAVDTLERARATHESAALLFNLSQAYGLALRLSEQAPTYSRARALDARAIERFTHAAGGDPSRILMPVQASSSLYLARALAPSAAAVRLARELRARLFGRRAPDVAWMALPLLGLIAAGLRRGEIARCRRCERALCAHCSPENQNATTCLRCVRLFEQRQNVDARVRQEQLKLDRRRQRLLALRAAGFALLAPGVAALRRGRCARGSAQLLLAALGAALLVSPDWIAAPWDVGPLARWTALFGGVALLAPAYVSAAREALRLARGRELRT